MLPPALAVFTVTIQEPQLISDHGTSVPDWSLPVVSSVSVPGCVVQPATGAEDDDHRIGNETDLSVWLPESAQVSAFSHLSVPAYPGVHEVIAEPMRFVTGLGLDHVQVRTRAWEG